VSMIDKDGGEEGWGYASLSAVSKKATIVVGLTLIASSLASLSSFVVLSHTQCRLLYLL